MWDVPPNLTGIVIVSILCSTFLGGIALGSWCYRRWMQEYKRLSGTPYQGRD